MKNVNSSYKILDPDNCAMCGMCLNNCPTYEITKNESESPRGRISIIHGLNDEMLEPSESALKHLNSCTLCMACESICPAKVNFYDLMTNARNKYFNNQTLIFKIKTILISSFLKNTFLKNIASTIIKLLNKEFLSGINKKMFRFMNYIQTHEKNYIKIIPKIKSNNKIGIFTGCATDLFQKNVANSCVRILEKNKINFEIIKNVKCCGSIDHNSGRLKNGIKFNKSIVKEFKKEKYKKVIGYASGCSAFINKHNKDSNYQDATSYIINLLENTKKENFKITRKNVCIHAPCTTNSANIDFQKLIYILKKIPGINILTFKDKYCCGAGAQNLIHNKENSREILKPKIEYLKSNDIDYLLTYNIGCSLNFIDSLNLNNKKDIKVIHPISFINDRLV